MNRCAERPERTGFAVGPLHAHDDDTLMVSAGLLAAAPTSNRARSAVGTRSNGMRKACSTPIMGDAAVRDVNVALLAAESLLEYYIPYRRRSHSEQVVLRCAAWLQDCAHEPLSVRALVVLGGEYVSLSRSAG
jgi:hypothetical protein